MKHAYPIYLVIIARTVNRNRGLQGRNTDAAGARRVCRCPVCDCLLAAAEILR